MSEALTNKQLADFGRELDSLSSDEWDRDVEGWTASNIADLLHTIEQRDGEIAELGKALTHSNGELAGYKEAVSWEVKLHKESIKQIADLQARLAGILATAIGILHELVDPLEGAESIRQAIDKSGEEVRDDNRE